MRTYFLVLILFLLAYQNSKGDSWKKVKDSKKSTLEVKWYTSIPFIYENSKGELTGLEYELIKAFEKYLSQKHSIELKTNWIQSESFAAVISDVKSSQTNNIIGLSAFSITEDRKQQVKFTNSYLPDITVLVSSEGTPIVRQFDDVNDFLKDMIAVTIKETIYEHHLLQMKKELDSDFEIKYINSEENVLDHISQSDRMFGFIDLPIYLMWIKDGRDLTRQNFFTMRGIGYGIIMPLSSDLDQPFNEFLIDPNSRKEITSIISKYLGTELYEFIDSSYDKENLSTYILTKEKEIQLALIKNTNLKLEKEKTFKRILILGIGATLFFLIFTMYMFYRNQKTTQLIIEQKDQIESHQSDIRIKNGQLMNRNAQLLALNEDKNNLVSILAHDLRSPLNNILGMIGLMNFDNANLNQEQQEYLDKINATATDMNEMIAKILDPNQTNTILKEQVNVNAMIEDLVSRYFSQASHKDIRIHTHLSRNINLESDHVLLFLVLENLLSNAIKFSNRNTEITLSAESNNQEVIISVADQGPGFSEDDKKLLFTRFQKLSAQPTGEESSTGLGLSIVKKYVTDLGGNIWLESEVGSGSTFFVSFKS